MVRRLVFAFLSGTVLAACVGASDTTTTTTDSTTTITIVRVEPTTTEAVTTTTTTRPPEIPPVGLVFAGGSVVTMDPELGTAEAIAIEADSIVAVGSAAEIAPYIGPDTVVIDLEGRSVIPGFVDAHTHILTDMGGIEEGQSLALANGITSVADASVEPDWAEAFIAAARSSVLRVRTSMYLARFDPCGNDQGFWYEAYPSDTVFSDRLRVGGVKLFADGGVCGLLGMSEPFLEGVAVGPPYQDLETLVVLIAEADTAGYQLAIHAQGDLAIERVQDAYAEVLGDGGNPLRHRIDHSVVPTSATIGRYGELGLVPVLVGSSEACNADLPWTDLYKTNAERPGDMLAANPDLVVAWHGDDPWLTPISPIIELFSLVTRARLNEDGTICEPPGWMVGGGVTVEQGLAMMTTGSAYAIRQDHLVGSLTPGRLADLVVLSQNLLTVAPEAILDVEVLMTMIGGVTEFCASGTEAWCPGSELPAGIDISASASRSGRGAELALDGLATGDSFWSSGADAPQWIRVDFAEPTAVSSLRFTVFQNPESNTLHELEVMIGGEWTIVATFSDFTTTGDVLDWEPTAGSPTIEAFRMTTLESLSWPEWYEIEIGD